MDMQARKDLYDFFRRVFQSELDEGFVDGLRGLGTTGDAELDAYLAASSQMGTAELTKALGCDYVRLFLGMSAHPVAPYESVFLSDKHLLMQEQRDQVVAAYRAEGFGVGEGFGLPEDHIAVELAFASHLCDRAMGALGQGDEDEAGRLEGVLTVFTGDHLAKWVPSFADEVALRESRGSAEPGFYGICARMLRDFLAFG